MGLLLVGGEHAVGFLTSRLHRALYPDPGARRADCPYWAAHVPAARATNFDLPQSDDRRLQLII